MRFSVDFNIKMKLKAYTEAHYFFLSLQGQKIQVRNMSSCKTLKQNDPWDGLVILFCHMCCNKSHYVKKITTVFVNE